MKIKKAILSILAVGFLVLSSFGAVVISEPESESENNNTVAFSISYSEPTISSVDNDEYVAIDVEGSNGQFGSPGDPSLPTIIKTIELPADARNIVVNVNPRDVSEQEMYNDVIPVPMRVFRDGTTTETTHTADSPIQMIGDGTNTEITQSSAYTSDSFYPNNWFNYRVTFGLSQEDFGTRVHKVHIEYHPVLWNPVDNVIHFTDGFDTEINFDTEDCVMVDTDDDVEWYDMIIIAPSAFSRLIQPLIDHKNSHDVDTKLKTVEEILDEYDGRDNPEKIKYFIKDAIETMGVTYVMLVGGLKSYYNANAREDANQGGDDWWVPVRYTNINLWDVYDPVLYSPDEHGCPSDLYYSDIYKTGGVFEDWDSNGNNIFAEADCDLRSYSDIRDVIDFDPDVYVGRLPCRNKMEVRIMVNKIINYERTGVNAKPWYDQMVAVAGKTGHLYNDQPDAEYTCDYVFENSMSDFTPLKVYASNNDTGGLRPMPKDIISAISRGAGFAFFEGHGNPFIWDTIWADGAYPKDWCGGLGLQFDMWKLLNLRKLPVVVVGGCHNSLFNVTITNPYWCHGTPTPVCWAWGFCILPWGGAIASMGSTGFGIGPSEGYPIAFSAWLEANFFESIDNGATHIAEAHHSSISRYYIVDAMDYHCITTFQLFGDPSLKFGGYGVI